MELHKFKKIDIGFAIISSQPNVGNLLCTVRSIKNNYPTAPYLCVVPKNTPAETFKRLAELCPIFKGKSTVTSLINVGLKKSKSDWTMILMEGTPLHKGLDRKYSLFIENESDVLYSLVIDYNKQGKPIKIRNSFDDAPINGTLIHKNVFQKVGIFSEDDESIPKAKLFWSAKATQLGCKFKGILRRIL